MATVKYMISKRLNPRDEAVFPDGSDSDCSTGTTFYNICRQCSSSTGQSELSEDSLFKHNSKLFGGDCQHESFVRLSLSSEDEFSNHDIYFAKEFPSRKESVISKNVLSEQTSLPCVLVNDIEQSNSGQETHEDVNSDMLHSYDPLMPCIDVIPGTPTIAVVTEDTETNQQMSSQSDRLFVTRTPLPSGKLTSMSNYSSVSAISSQTFTPNLKLMPPSRVSSRALTPHSYRAFTPMSHHSCPIQRFFPSQRVYPSVSMVDRSIEHRLGDLTTLLSNHKVLPSIRKSPSHDEKSQPNKDVLRKMSISSISQESFFYRPENSITFKRLQPLEKDPCTSKKTRAHRSRANTEVKVDKNTKLNHQKAQPLVNECHIRTMYPVTELKHVSDSSDEKYIKSFENKKRISPGLKKQTKIGGMQGKDTRRIESAGGNRNSRNSRTATLKKGHSRKVKHGSPARRFIELNIRDPNSATDTTTHLKVPSRNRFNSKS